MDLRSSITYATAVVTLALCVFLAFQKEEETEGLDVDAVLRIEANQKQVSELRTEIETLKKKLASQPRSQPGLSARQIEGIVKEAVANRGGELPAKKDVSEEIEAVENETELNFNKTMANFVAMANDFEGRQSLWAALRKAGKLDEAIAWLEERAKNSPENADAHCDLAEGYIAKLQGGGTDYGMLADLSRKADAAFDKTLEVDDQHWRGRLQKAIALSFWPPNLGKQGEAIKHFEILVEQQKDQTPNKGHAMTHMFLGNMYSQQGKMEKAKESWKRGLIADPDNAQLRKLLQNAGGN